MSALEASSGELKAIAQFVSQDETRVSLNVIWQYRSEGGLTYFASDGHTMVVRRSGTHVVMEYRDIEKLPVTGGQQGIAPPKWSLLLAHPVIKTAPEWRSINCAYMARIAVLERAAGKRAAEDWVPSRPGLSKKDAAEERKKLLSSALVKWRLAGGMDPWVFEMMSVAPNPAVAWSGAVMPRRL